MLFLVPFDAATVRISLPVDSRLDRFALTALALVWLATVAARGPGRPRFVRSPVDLALLGLILTAGLSTAINLPQLGHDFELLLAIKKLSLLGSYLFFFYIVSTSVRLSEIDAFVTLIIGLACVMAAGIVVEFRTGTNVFYEYVGAALPLSDVTSIPFLAGALNRPDIVGPTSHGLAACTLLSLVIPFAVLRLVSATGRRRIVYALIVVLLLTGAVSTQRKTAVVLPAVALLTIAFAAPRRVLRYWPLGLVGIVAIQFAAPGAISGLRYQFTTARSSNSTAGRTADYAATAPDISSHLLLGRGFGSFDPLKYRILDNQLLGILIETGVLGLIAYVMTILAAAVSVRWLIRNRTTAAARLKSDIATAVVAACAVFLVSNVLFDAFGFRHGPYAFFLVAALGVALTRDRQERAGGTER